MIQVLLTALLEKGANYILKLDPVSLARLAPLTDKVISIAITGKGYQFYVHFHAEGVHLLWHYDGAVDAEIAGDFSVLFPLLVNKSTVLPAGVQLQGDTALIQQVQQIAQNLTIDWEEYLSHYLGDIIAHKAGNLAQHSQQWGTQVLKNLRLQLTDYLQEEIRLLVSRAELEDFYTAVYDLQSDVDRAAARLQQLKKMQTLEQGKNL